jgi:hypothetical protein
MGLLIFFLIIIAIVFGIIVIRNNIVDTTMQPFAHGRM